MGLTLIFSFTPMQIFLLLSGSAAEAAAAARAIFAQK
jgi:hypothetical protein